jgi:hypothetical protein
MAQLWRECTRCRRRRFLAHRPGPPKTELWDGCPDCALPALESSAPGRSEAPEARPQETPKGEEVRGESSGGAGRSAA